jgi:hypothetical protein
MWIFQNIYWIQISSLQKKIVVLPLIFKPFDWSRIAYIDKLKSSLEGAHQGWSLWFLDTYMKM